MKVQDISAILLDTAQEYNVLSQDDNLLEEKQIF